MLHFLIEPAYDLIASKHDENVVYAAFNNHKSGDFTPYVYKSSDKGRSWTSIANNLPAGAVYALEQDHVNGHILFAGTEYGIYVSVDEGTHWKKFGACLPTTNVRDMAIQERENDLVLGTFGRGFYVLDNYAPLRELVPATLEKTAHIFAVKDAVIFNSWQPLGSLGSREKGFQGEMFYAAPNPEKGAVFTYWVKEAPGSLKSERTKREKAAFKAGEAIPYPSLEAYKEENSELPSYLVFTIKDAVGEIVSELRTSVKKGIHRITWDLTYAGFGAVNKHQDSQTKSLPSSGIYVVPGSYTVTLSRNIRSELTEIVGPVSFEVKALDNRSLPAEDRAAMAAFKKKALKLVNALDATRSTIDQMNNKLRTYKAAAKALPAAQANAMMKEILTLEKKMKAVDIQLNGDADYARLDLDSPYSTRQRAQNSIFDIFRSTSNVTGTSQTGYNIAADEFALILATLRGLMGEFDQMDSKLDQNGAPLTPGRLPNWRKE